MPVSVAVIIVVTATLAMATIPKSTGVSSRPRTSEVIRFRSRLDPSWAAFHSKALPARFSSVAPTVTVFSSGVAEASAVSMSIQACRHASQQVNHERPAIDLAQQITLQCPHTPSLGPAGELVNEPHEEAGVVVAEAAAEPTALRI